jgi:hypothetical protein
MGRAVLLQKRFMTQDKSLTDFLSTAGEYFQGGANLTGSAVELVESLRGKPAAPTAAANPSATPTPAAVGGPGMSTYFIIAAVAGVAALFLLARK